MCFLFCQQGLNFCLPVLDTIRHIQSLKEIAIAIPEQSAITVGKSIAWVALRVVRGSDWQS